MSGASEAWQEYFGNGRHWRVGEEYTGKVALDEIILDFDKGHFEISPPGVFQSPLSLQRGRKGVILQEVDGQGQDIPRSVAVFGEHAVKRARTTFKAIW